MPVGCLYLLTRGVTHFRLSEDLEISILGPQKFFEFDLEMNSYYYCIYYIYREDNWRPKRATSIFYFLFLIIIQTKRLGQTTPLIKLNKDTKTKD